MADLFLIASHDAATIRAAEAALKEDGVAVLVAHDGLQTLDMALDRAPSAIFLSVDLAHVDGVEVARALRALKPTEHVPFIFLAENEAEANEIAKENLPFTESLVAPFQIEKIKKKAALALRTGAQLADMHVYETNGLAYSINDPLTHVYQRRYAIHRLAYEAARSVRYKNPLSVLLVDVDHLEEINREHGMLIGDTVLIEVAQILYRTLRRTDLIGRYDLQDFILVLPETPEDNAVKLADRVCRTVAETKFLNGKLNLRATVSVGVAGANGTDMAENLALIGRAATALDHAKREGKNRLERG